MTESTHEHGDDVRIRGRPNAPVVQQAPLRPFATPAHPPNASLNHSNSGTLFFNQPLPEPKYKSQISMNRVYMSEVETPIRGSSFQENRDHFIRLFDEQKWNYPDEELNSLEPKLVDRRALVIAIHYGGGDPLPATYVDALNITHMLVKFDYHPKCIRVLADQVDLQDCKDKRWPNKDNIVAGLNWLVQGTVPGCKRFLFFAGHGHRLMTNKEDVYFTREGILPRDFLTYTTRSGKDVPDPKTILFDDELNRLLVRVGDGTKLTVVFDVCAKFQPVEFGGFYSIDVAVKFTKVLPYGGLTVLVPETADLSNIRKRCLFTMGRRPSNPDEIDDICCRALADQSGIGNLLGLPSRINFNQSGPQGFVARSELTEEPTPQDSKDLGTSSFTAFPESCEIISWAACDGSQLAREDANVGGRFTSAFTKGLLQEEEGVIQITYRILNRRIQTEFDTHNEKVNDPNNSAATGSGQNSAIRASKTQNAVQKDEYYQYPKLYVSNNIASTIPDREVVI